MVAKGRGYSNYSSSVCWACLRQTAKLPASGALQHRGMRPAYSKGRGQHPPGAECSTQLESYGFAIDRLTVAGQMQPGAAAKVVLGSCCIRVCVHIWMGCVVVYFGLAERMMHDQLRQQLIGELKWVCVAFGVASGANHAGMVLVTLLSVSRVFLGLGCDLCRGFTVFACFPCVPGSCFVQNVAKCLVMLCASDVGLWPDSKVSSMCHSWH